MAVDKQFAVHKENAKTVLWYTRILHRWPGWRSRSTRRAVASKFVVRQKLFFQKKLLASLTIMLYLSHGLLQVPEGRKNAMPCSTQ